jgi:hypothetical protein
VECASDVDAACQRVTSALRAVGVPVASQLLGTGSGTDSLAVVVGTWSDLHGLLAGALIERGPSASGGYARFTRVGRRLQLLNPQGRVTRTLGAGAGLIAATAQGSDKPTWLITGTDGAGVSAAASVLTASSLRDHFALAVAGGRKLPVPRP